MDFDLIDNLSESDVAELYSDVITDSERTAAFSVTLSVRCENTGGIVYVFGNVKGNTEPPPATATVGYCAYNTGHFASDNSVFCNFSRATICVTGSSGGFFGTYLSVTCDDGRVFHETGAAVQNSVTSTVGYCTYNTNHFRSSNNPLCGPGRAKVCVEAIYE